MKLFPYQQTGVEWLAQNKRAYLADEMGLGKTVQAIVAAKEIGVHRTLVVCPASVRENWKREWSLWGGSGELTVLSYAAMPGITSAWSALNRFNLVILDEAHYCKTPSAKRTKAALRLAAGAPRAWLLSGTPMPNDPRELYAVFKVLWPDLFPALDTQFKWMDRFCLWGDSEYGYRVWGTTPRARTELVPALHGFMLRRRLRDVALELPPLRFTVQHLDPNPALAQELEELGASGDEEHMSTMRRILGEYKAPLVAAEINRELDEEQYDSIVVLYHHHNTRDALRRAFKGRHIHGFDGSMNPVMRQVEIDRFQHDGGIFLAQQGAAGVGITLTRASEIVLVEPDWSPEANQQAIKRIHRIGQDEPCRARMFAVPDSLDEALMNTLKRKSKMIEEVVNG